MNTRIGAMVVICASISAIVLAQAKDPVRERLDRAKANYRMSVELAQKKLTEDFEVAVQNYTRAGNLDGALATRQERDGFLQSIQVALPPINPPAVLDGKWTIVFRSSDPLLFGVPVQNGKSFAIGLDQLPRDYHCVRLRRMDTGEAVILGLGDGPLGSYVARGDYAWRGDKRINRQACNLGIIQRKSRAGNRELAPIMLMDSGDYTGWGFGEWWTGQERQGYVWNGKGIDSTVMEIAVANGPLTAAEQAQLLNP